MRHNKLVIAAVAACIVLSAATIDAQSWKRGLGKLKQGVEQVTRQSKPNTTRQSGDVQVPEWHEERAQKRTSGLPSSVDTVVNHLRYRLRPDSPAESCPLYIMARAPSKNLVDIPTTALTHIQKMAPGPPTVIAIATPAIFPIPTVDAMALIKAWKELICPSPATSDL